MGLDNLWKPDLRGRIEQGISRIAAGLVTKDTVSVKRRRFAVVVLPDSWRP
jgi:hypothetical protein